MRANSLKIAMIFPFVENYTETNEQFAKFELNAACARECIEINSNNNSGSSCRVWKRQKYEMEFFVVVINCVCAIDVTRDRFK